MNDSLEQLKFDLKDLTNGYDPTQGSSGYAEAYPGQNRVPGSEYGMESAVPHTSSVEQTNKLNIPDEYMKYMYLSAVPITIATVLYMWQPEFILKRDTKVYRPVDMSKLLFFTILTSVAIIYIKNNNKTE